MAAQHHSHMCAIPTHQLLMHALPPEIFDETVALSATMVGDANVQVFDIHRLLMLATVSKTWRRNILRSQKLWQSLHPSTKQRFNHIAMKWMTQHVGGVVTSINFANPRVHKKIHFVTCKVLASSLASGQFTALRHLRIPGRPDCKHVIAGALNNPTTPFTQLLTLNIAESLIGKSTDDLEALATAIGRMSNLQSLDISNSHIVDDNANSFVSTALSVCATSLTQLNVSGNQGIVAFLPAMPQLQSLNCSRCKIDIAALPSLTLVINSAAALTNLDVSRNATEGVISAMMSGMSANVAQRLISLDAERCSLRSHHALDGFSALANLPLTSLTHLNLGNNKFEGTHTDAHDRMGNILATASSLRSLHLNTQFMGAAVVCPTTGNVNVPSWWVPLSRLSHLTSLDMSGSCIHRSLHHFLPLLANCTALADLRLATGRFPQAHFGSVSPLQHLTALSALTLLDLDDTDVGYNECSQLAQCLAHPSMSSLTELRVDRHMLTKMDRRGAVALGAGRLCPVTGKSLCGYVKAPANELNGYTGILEWSSAIHGGVRISGLPGVRLRADGS